MSQLSPTSTAPAPAPASSDVRNDWSREEIAELFALPLSDLILRAQVAHRRHFPANRVQLSTLLSIKTGGCSEDCAYCPQSARYETEVDADGLMPLEEVVENALIAKASGATRYCMGAAWRSPKGRNFDRVVDMVHAVKQLGMETCVTLGMLDDGQATRLREAGLDYYNHNIDTSPEYYGEVITTRTYQDRLDTLERVRTAGIHVCCGGIVGMGESREDRVGMVHTLATMETHPESVPVNLLVRVEGTPLAEEADFDGIEFVKTIAVSKITMPASHVRLSAGREQMSDELQALCFLAGASSVFCGPKLLTTPNPEGDRDAALFARLGIEPL